MKYGFCTLALACGLTVTGLSAQTTTSSPAGTGTSSTTNAAPKTGAASAPSSRPASSTAATGQNEAPTPPAHPITQAQTREMFELMGYKKLMDNMLNQTIAMQKQQAPFVPADVWTDFQTTFSNVDYVALLQPIYAKYISEDEAAKSLEFYRTPAGRHMLESMPMLMRDIMVTSQQNGQKIGREVIDRHRPEIEAAQKKYQQEQQGNAPGAGSTGASTNGTASPRTGTAPNSAPAPSLKDSPSAPSTGTSSTTPKPPQQ